MGRLRFSCSDPKICSSLKHCFLFETQHLMAHCSVPIERAPASWATLMIRLPTLIDAVKRIYKARCKELKRNHRPGGIAPPEKPFSWSFAGWGLGRGRCLRQNICLNRLHLVRFQRVLERRHAAVFEIAAQHDGLELMMRFRGSMAQIRNSVPAQQPKRATKGRSTRTWPLLRAAGQSRDRFVGRR